MRVYLHDPFEAFDLSHETSRVIRDLLRTLSERRAKVSEATLRSARNLIPRLGVSIDDAEFVQYVLTGLTSFKSENQKLEAVSSVLQILTKAAWHMQQVIAAEPVPEPVESEGGRYAELLTFLDEDVRGREGNVRRKRHALIEATLQDRPGLYITELYKLLVALRAVDVTYWTLWADIRLMERAKKLISIGGPQGSPRYCFPHPDAVSNRRKYYGNYYCTQGTVEERLTDRFQPTRRYLDLYLVNSESKALILVLRYHATNKDITGIRVKTFGRLQPFDFLMKEEGLQPRGRMESHDVLRTVNVTEVTGREEHTLWHDAEAIRGHSLYEGSTMAATA